MNKPPLRAAVSIDRAYPENEELTSNPMISAIPLQFHTGGIFRTMLNYGAEIWLSWYAKALIILSIPQWPIAPDLRVKLAVPAFVLF
jgi:hypothetical protein